MVLVGGLLCGTTTAGDSPDATSHDAPPQNAACLAIMTELCSAAAEEGPAACKRCIHDEDNHRRIVPVCNQTGTAKVFCGFPATPAGASPVRVVHRHVAKGNRTHFPNGTARPTPITPHHAHSKLPVGSSGAPSAPGGANIPSGSLGGAAPNVGGSFSKGPPKPPPTAALGSKSADGDAALGDFAAAFGFSNGGQGDGPPGGSMGGGFFGGPPTGGDGQGPPGGNQWGGQGGGGQDGGQFGNNPMGGGRPGRGQSGQRPRQRGMGFGRGRPGMQQNRGMNFGGSPGGSGFGAPGGTGLGGPGGAGFGGPGGGGMGGPGGTGFGGAGGAGGAGFGGPGGAGFGGPGGAGFGAPGGGFGSPQGSDFGAPGGEQSFNARQLSVKDSAGDGNPTKPKVSKNELLKMRSSLADYKKASHDVAKLARGNSTRAKELLAGKLAKRKGPKDGKRKPLPPLKKPAGREADVGSVVEFRNTVRESGLAKPEVMACLRGEAINATDLCEAILAARDAAHLAPLPTL